MGFGERLRKARMEKGMRQEDIGKVVHVGKSTVSQWENNIHVPDLETITKIANHLNISVDWLTGRISTPSPIPPLTPEDMKKLDEYKKTLDQTIFQVKEILGKYSAKH